MAHFRKQGGIFLNTKEAKKMYENASEDMKACMDIIEKLSKKELHDITLFLKFAKDDKKGANWILQNYEKLGGLSFATMIQLAKNELYGDAE